MPYAVNIGTDADKIANCMWVIAHGNLVLAAVESSFQFTWNIAEWRISEEWLTAYPVETRHSRQTRSN